MARLPTVRSQQVSTTLPNPWFRLYSEFATDPKVQMMTEAMQRRLVMLLCSRCNEETLHETEMAFHWRCSDADIAETKNLFVQKGFIDESWNLVNWNRRQFISDSSTDRVRKYRQALKQDETLHVTDETVTVTAPEQNRTDSEAETKQKTPRAKKPRDGFYEPIKELIFRYYRAKNEVDPEWNGREGKALAMLLAANPNAPLDHWKRCLTNRFHSEVTHGERPGVWIGKLSSFTVPLNQYGKPLNGGNDANGQFKGKTTANIEAAQRAIDRIAERGRARREASTDNPDLGATGDEAAGGAGGSSLRIFG